MRLRTGVAIQVMALLAAALGVLGFFVEALTRHGLEAQVDERVEGALRQRLRNLDQPKPAAPGPVADGYPPTATLIFDRTGRLIDTRASGVNDIRDPLPVLDVDWALRHRGQIGTAPATDGTIRYRARAATASDGRVVVEAAPMRSADASVRRLRRTLWIGSTGVLIAAGLASSALIGRSLRPLTAIARAAGQIAAGDRRRRVAAPSRYHELQQLGTSLDEMVGELTTALVERTRALEVEASSKERLRRFAADASHELRTPITSIRGWAELCRIGGVAGTADVGAAMGRIEREATRMARLVDDLLLLARAGEVRSGRQEPIDLTLVCSDAVISAQMLDPDRSVELATPDCEALVLGDPDQLRQVVDNLLANVRVHTPPGTRTSVRTRNEGPTVVLTISDDGPGFPDGSLADVFDRAWQGPRRSDTSSGHGLGLAIARTIVTAHGGSIRASHAEPHGACVIVSLPHHPSDPGSP